MNKLPTKVALCLGVALLGSNVTYANNFYADGRTTGMGGTGVASGNYLAASFINPALLANSQPDDGFGLLLPSIGIRAVDSDETLSHINDLQDSYDGLHGQSTQDDIDEFAKNLNALSDAKPVSVEGSAGLAIALPFDAVSVALFSQSYLNLISMADVAHVDSNDWASIEQAYNDSTASIVGIGVMDVGVTFAKKFTFDEQSVSVGVSPKFQQLHSFYSKSALNDYKISDYDDVSTTENTFNIDLGLLYQWRDLSVGLSALNLISQDIETVEVLGQTHTYKVEPHIGVGFAYQLKYFTFAADADLNKQTRFASVSSDDTQFVRAGVEGNLFDWAQLRLGYEHDLEGNLEDSVTAGIGLSPFGVVHLDIAGSYANETQAAVGVNLSLTL
ncbi:conjugal transfer protein TraF [Vibrio rarus]|uniref:conjugal transfer protein TraF n=1 Tax=Vibrio rarus TaxID=413403 RepID=UPI0021C384E2|nr:conjugal transfer protein TraF [Vibrio rarus]